MMNKYCDFNKKHKIEITIRNLYEAVLIFLEEFLSLIFIIFIVCVHMCTWHMFKYLWRIEDDIKSDGARAAGGCEMLIMDAENWTLALWKRSKNS